MPEDTAPDPRLEATYRRLIYAYPSSYRRERGLELLTTLLDAAQQGQRRPHWRDTLDLVAGGIRARLKIPPGRLYRVVAVTIAIFVGLSVSAFSARLVWIQTHLVPDQATALAVADRVAGLTHVDDGFYTGDTWIIHVDWMGKSQLTPPRYEGWPGRPPSPGATLAFYDPPGEPIAFLTDARSRLSAQGWEVGELTATDVGTGFWAGKEGFLVRLAHERPGRHSVVVRVHDHEPGIVTVVALAGLVLGAVAGWLAASWSTRRFATQTPAVRTGMLFMGVPGCLAAGCLVAWSVVGSAMTLWHWGWSQRAWLMTGTVLDEAFIFTTLVYTALALSLLLSAWRLPARQAVNITAIAVFVLITIYAFARQFYLPGRWW